MPPAGPRQRMVDLWRWTLARTRAGRFAEDTYTALVGLALGFRGGSLNLRAGNLTFISIFSLIPVLTVALAALHQLQQRALQERLEGFVRESLAPGVQDETAALLDRFFQDRGAATAGGISFVFLMISAGMLLRNLDASLNEIWRVQRRRPLGISVLLYGLALTIGPLLAAIWLVGLADLRRLILGTQLPFSREMTLAGSAAASVAVFTLIFKFAPHAPVRLRSALSGGLVGGLAWEIARHTYSEFARLAVKHSPVYGSLGAAPLFLTWLYVSWWLLLFGAKLSNAVEHATFRGHFRDVVAHPRARELVAARMAQLVTASYISGTQPPTVEELAGRLHLPPQTVQEVGHLLIGAGLLVANKRGGLIPARAPSELSLADLSAAVGGQAKRLGATTAGSKLSDFQELEHLFASGDDASAERLAQVSWSQLPRADD